jgi:threonyl-tRNA synthetase
MSHEVEQDQNVLSPHLYYLQLFSKQGVLQIPLDQMVPVQKENKNNKLE